MTTDMKALMSKHRLVTEAELFCSYQLLQHKEDSYDIKNSIEKTMKILTNEYQEKFNQLAKNEKVSFKALA